MAFNPFLKTDLRDVLAQGANVGDIRNYNGRKFRFSGTSWDPEGGSLGGPTGGSMGGRQTLSNFDQNAFFDRQRREREDLLKKQEEKETRFINRFRDVISSQEAIPAMATRIGKELGVDDLRTEALTLSQTLKNMPQELATQAKGRTTALSQDQLDRITADRQMRLRPQAQDASSLYLSASDLMNQRLALGQAQQAKELQPFQYEAQFLSDRLSREFTGFTTGQENQLNGILAKLSAGTQLDMQEMKQAHDLAMQEQSYIDQKNLLEEQFRLESQRPIMMSEGSSLVDPSTGKVLKNIPKTYKPEKPAYNPFQSFSQPSQPSGAWKIMTPKTQSPPSYFTPNK